ncbi:retrovirus-related pol polyprotein from transposon TNT 1-94 [Tanacetum coccineum]
MHEDFEYVKSLEKEVDELESEKADFSNMYDLLLEECVSKDVICSYLHSLSELNAHTELQCMYLHKVKECECLAQKLSNTLNLLNNEMKNNPVCKENASNVFRKEREQYHEIQDLKAQMQDKNMVINELKKLILTVQPLHSLFTSGCNKQHDGQSQIYVNFCGEIPGKSTCFVRDLQRNDLLTGSRESDLYTISLQEKTSSTLILFMIKLTNSSKVIGIEGLPHLNFDYITLLSKKEVVTGLPKLKYVKDQLCSSCEMSKAKRSSFKTKAFPSSKGRLNLLHMDLCGPMRVDETLEVLKDFLMMIQRNLQAQVITVRTDRGTKFLNKTLHAYFKEEGIKHQTSTPRTPEQNGVVEIWNRTLVEAARMMLSASKLPLSFWAEAVATACYTQNRSIIISTHGKTAYHIINDSLVPQGQKASDYDNSDPEPPRQNFCSFSRKARFVTSRVRISLRQLATDPEMDNRFALDWVSIVEPKNIKEAMADSAWIEAMQDELHQFDRLKVWELVDKPFGKMIIKLKWLWKNKKDEDQTVIRNKALTFSDIVGPRGAAHKSFPIYQMDVKMAFLNGQAPRPRLSGKQYAIVPTLSSTTKLITPQEVNMDSGIQRNLALN